jgi:hypothetical protein
LSGALQWYSDLLGVLFYVFMLAGAVNLATGGGQLFRKLSVFLVAAVPALTLLGLIRAVALVRRSTGATWRDAIGAFFIWQSTALVVARASVLALFAKKAAFLRTPKTSERTSWWHALRANWAETILAVLGAAGIAGALTKATTLSGPLLAGLLFVPTLGMAAAPFNSWAARRAALPALLRARRDTEFRRERRSSVTAGIAAGAAIAVIGVSAAAIALLLTGRLTHGPSLVNPLPPATTSAPAPSASPTTVTPTTASPTTATPTSASPTASPTSATPSATTATPTASATSATPTGTPSATATPTATSTSTPPP